jgi:hypothetical protein
VPIDQTAGLAALTALVPPPAAPRRGDRDWDWLFAELGTRLPAEYVALMDTYGSGEWLEWLAFPHPHLAEGRHLPHTVRWTTDLHRDRRQRFPDTYSYPVWPEPGGFLPFASTIDADWLAWHTVGESDDWPVVHHSRHFPGRRTTAEHDLTTTLLNWVRGGPLFDLKWEPGEDPREESVFRPL